MINIDIRVGPVSGSRLVHDYHGGEPTLSSFYVGSPWDLAAYRRKITDVEARFTAERRAELRDVVRASSPAAQANWQKVVDGDALVVTTGQQAGVFGGPLYTVYKLLTTIQLARELTRQLGRDVLPLFWVASDDHDWEEINHVVLVDTANSLRRIEVPSATDRAAPAGARTLGAGVLSALEELERALPATEFTPRVLELLRSAYTPEQTVAAAFSELLAALFAEFDLLLVDPRHPALKQQAALILSRELKQAQDHEQKLAAQTARLVQAGYHAQVSVLPGEANVFFEGGHGRERLVRAPDGWQLKASGERFDHDALLARLAAEPSLFSPNVFLRPVVESALLPTIAYVGGPAELGYFAQIGCLFAAHEVQMPVVFPRFGVTLVEGRIRKVLDKHHLDVEDLSRPIQEVTARVVREELPAHVSETLANLRASWTEGFAALADGAASIDATLRGPLTGARNTGLQQLAEAEKKITQSLRRQSATTLEQIEKAATNLYPNGSPQERTLNVIQYLARYGADLLPAIADAMPIELQLDAPTWAGVECA